METQVSRYEVVSFDSRFVRVSGLPKMMSWGLLLTPTPALVPAATSTRYCTPAWSPPTTTERMVASTDLLTWKRVSLAKHQIWQRQTSQERIYCKVARYITKIFRCRVWSYLVLLDDAVLLVGWRWVPWHADGRAVVASYCQHCHLLRRGTRCWLEGEKHSRNKRIKWFSIYFFVSPVFFIMSKKDLSHPLPPIHIHKASHTTRYFLSQHSRWLPQHFISISYLNGRISFV